MLSGQYDFLIENMDINNVIAIILFLIPLFLLFVNKKWIIFFYTISIIANLPLIFYYTFKFSYELILVCVIIIKLIKEIYDQKEFKYITTKNNLQLIAMLVVLIIVNIVTSFFNFSKQDLITRLIIYLTNIGILFVYTYVLKDLKILRYIKNGIIIGSVILVLSMIVELIYGHYYLGIRNMRPAGLLLDPNVAGFALNIALVTSFMDRKKWVFIYDLLIIASRIIILFGIFLTVSRSAYLGTILIIISLMIVYSKSKYKWIMPSVVIVFILFYLIFNNVVNNFFSTIYQIIDLRRIFPKLDNFPSPPNGGNGGGSIPNEDYSNARILLLKTSLIIFSNNFLVGVGIGNVVPSMKKITNLPMNSHNLYLQLLAESGIFMLFVMLIFLYYIIVFLRKLTINNRSIIYMYFGLFFIESLFNHNILNVNLTYVILAIILFLATYYSNEKIVVLIKNWRAKIGKSHITKLKKL